jgi:pyruvate dehydrogenase E2 component (dihydrolipoamide acetyltransferase)
MATFFAMPKLGLNMTQGVIVNWLVKEGGAVKEGAPIVEVETDKATQEVEATASGILAKIVAAVGEEVPCNNVIAVITAVGEALPAKIPVNIAEGIGPTNELQGIVERKTAVEEKQEDQQPDAQRRINISPSAAALAKELGVDITKIVAKGGRIKREDVEAAFEAMKSKKPEKAGVPSIKKAPMSTMRRKIAEHMNQSARSVARVALALEVDATKLVAKREATRVDGAKISYNVLLAKHVAAALKEFPYMNAQLNGEEIWEFGDINVGIAVDSERGLFVPVLQSVDNKSIETLQKEFISISGRATVGKSTVEDLSGGTFTITNLGNLEIESFLPVINVPECAILGVGAIIQKAVVIDGNIGVRPRMTLTLAFDHRLVDGAPAARFLQRVKVLIEEI